MLSYALGSSELAQIMIEAGADVNAVDTYGFIHTFHCICFADLRVARTYGGHSCSTMLAAATNAENLDVARLLIKAGASVNSLVISEHFTSSDDDTSNMCVVSCVLGLKLSFLFISASLVLTRAHVACSLSHAARQGNFAAVELLLQNAADPTVTLCAAPFASFIECSCLSVASTARQQPTLPRKMAI
jgi:hypothetical protein